MVSALDEAIGNITDQLRESGLYDDTLIVFTADASIVDTKIIHVYFLVRLRCYVLIVVHDSFKIACVIDVPG